MLSAPWKGMTFPNIFRVLKANSHWLFKEETVRKWVRCSIEIEHVWEMSFKMKRKTRGKDRKRYSHGATQSREAVKKAFKMTKNWTAFEGNGRFYDFSVRVWDWRFKHETLGNFQDLFHGSLGDPNERSSSNISASFPCNVDRRLQYCVIKHSVVFNLILALLWGFICSDVWLILRVPRTSGMSSILCCRW